MMEATVNILMRAPALTNPTSIHLPGFVIIQLNVEHSNVVVGPGLTTTYAISREDNYLTRSKLTRRQSYIGPLDLYHMSA